jgi:hypothetical protein
MRGKPWDRRKLIKTTAAGAAAATIAAPGDRADQSEDQLAPDLELSEEPRHAVRHLDPCRQARRRGDRRQFPDPDLRRRRDRAGAAGARRRPERHGRVQPHAGELLYRQGHRLRLRDFLALRPQYPPAERLALPGRWARALPRPDEEVRRAHDSLGQHRRADGRLVPQGDQERRGSPGAEVPHRRPRRPDHGQARRGAADARRW